MKEGKEEEKKGHFVRRPILFVYGKLHSKDGGKQFLMQGMGKEASGEIF